MPPAVVVHLPAIIDPSASVRTFQTEGETVREVLDTVIARYPSSASRLRGTDGAISPFVALYVNGADIRFGDGLDSRLKEGDEILVLLAMAGG